MHTEMEDVFMAASKQPASDRRAVPRKQVHLDCQVIFKENEYDAVMQDISNRGAFLWSSFMPPNDSVVIIRLKPSLKKQPLILKGKVVRCDSKYKEHGRVGAFAITFNHNSPSLLQTLSDLINPKIGQSKNKVSG
jgi:hypothetical protein